MGNLKKIIEKHVPEVPPPAKSSNHATREFILKHVNHGLGNVIQVPFAELRREFGFKRASGDALLIARILKPSKSEEELQMDSDVEIHISIRNWCDDNKVQYMYLEERHVYRFKSDLPYEKLKQTILEKIRDKERMNMPMHMRPTMVILNYGIAHDLYDRLRSQYYSVANKPDGKLSIFGLSIIEATNIKEEEVFVF